MMELKSVGILLPIYDGKVIIQPCSSHHQPEYVEYVSGNIIGNRKLMEDQQHMECNHQSSDLEMATNQHSIHIVNSHGLTGID